MRRIDPESYKVKQEEYLERLRTANDSSSCLVLEYGNTCEKSENGRTRFVTFCREAARENRGRAQKLPNIAGIDFNINPSYAKPTATVLGRDKGSRLGFSFGYSFTRCFPCVMTVHFEDRALPDLVIDYRVREEETARRIVVQLRSTFSGRRFGKQDKVEFSADPPRNGWIRFGGAGADSGVEYLPESHDKEQLEEHFGKHLL